MLHVVKHLSFLPNHVWQANRATFYPNILLSHLCNAERSSSRLPDLFGEANLPRHQSGVPEGGNDDELVAVPLRGLAELDVERFTCRADYLAVGQDHLPAEGPSDVGDDGDPVAAAELDRIRGVHVHIGEHAQHLPHRCSVRFPPIDWLGIAGDVRDHVWVVDCVYRCEVAGVEGVVALFHERKQVCGPAGVSGVQDGSLSDRFFALASSEDICLLIHSSFWVIVSRVRCNSSRGVCSICYCTPDVHRAALIALKWLDIPVQRSRVSSILSSFLFRSLLSFFP